MEVQQQFRGRCLTHVMGPGLRWLQHSVIYGEAAS